MPVSMTLTDELYNILRNMKEGDVITWEDNTIVATHIWCKEGCVFYSEDADGRCFWKPLKGFIGCPCVRGTNLWMGFKLATDVIGDD